MGKKLLAKITVREVIILLTNNKSRTTRSGVKCTRLVGKNPSK